VAIRGPSPGDGRGQLLAFGMFALALSLGAAGAVGIGADHAPSRLGPASASAPTVPGAAGPLWRAEAETRPRVESSRIRADPRAPPEGTAVLAFRGQDGREYLAKMAAMMRQRGAVTYVGPYQASLDPALYLAGPATPVDVSGREAISSQQPRRLREPVSNVAEGH
jgi:hypothetical protein